MSDDPLTSPSKKSEIVEFWAQAITAARRDEKEWMDEAEKAEKAFRGDKSSKDTRFNIYHSNIEIQANAAYNSAPSADVRRRFSDDDPIGKVVADLLERALDYSIDAYDFSARQKLAVYDMLVAGRGLVRVRYEPTVAMDNELEVESVQRQEVECEFVPWRRFIRGPGVTWNDVPWVAFEHFLSPDQVKKLAPGLVKKIPYNYTDKGRADGNKQLDRGDVPAQFLRAWVHEIWDKRSKTVLFVCPEYQDAIIRQEDDPLGMSSFFPVPQPMYGIEPVGGLSPVCPLTIYRTLIDELNVITGRISKLARQLRPRAGYIGPYPDMKKIAEADDGELVPLSSTDPAVQATGTQIDKLIAWFPLDQTTVAFRELIVQREALKQQIYEVTGIADIMRGASAPTETATAQQLKSQFGSVRVRALQAEVARFCRDILRMKAELMARFFEPKQLMAMTGITLLPQAAKQQLMEKAQSDPQRAQQVAQQRPDLVKAMQQPALEEVMAVIRSDKMRGYRVDIETDSTIRGDMMRNQEQMSLFLQGTAQYMSAMAPAVQQGAMPMKAAVEIYTAFARNFNLGKSAEDALDRLGQAAENAQQADPNAQAGQQAQIEVQSKEKIKAAEIQAKAQGEQQKIAVEAQQRELDRQSSERIAAMQAQIDQLALAVKQQDAQMKDARERDKAAQEIDLRRADATQKNMIAARAADSKAENDAMRAKQKATAN